MKAFKWIWGWLAALAIVDGLLAVVFISGSTLFNPGPLSAEHPQGSSIADFTSHADFESRCELCHAPFLGPAADLCSVCHTDVGDQMTSAQGVHGRLPNPQACANCHSDHKGRTASLTRVSFADMPHNQFGFTLAHHQRDDSGAPLACQACHTLTPSGQADPAAVLAACVSCHARQDARFIADHRAAMGEACLACHDGTDRLQGFDHATVFALDGKHAPAACAKCHVNDIYRGTPRECVQCHAGPDLHRGQFGDACVACHTSAGWRPARLTRHTFPLDHSGKQSACKVCHPSDYATYTCYNCHEHDQTKIVREHVQQNIQVQECVQCHWTGKKTE